MKSPRLVAAVLCLGAGTAFTEVSMQTARTLAFVIHGESNSGGIGLNADATAAERAPRPGVQILNPAEDRLAFEDLRLGVNNLRGHRRLEAYEGICHGLENALALAVEAGLFAPRRQVYLIKTGQGGSRIAQWAPDARTGYWQTWLERVRAGKQQLPPDTQWVLWFSLGINDGIDGTPIPGWQDAVAAHLDRIRAELPGVVIVMTQFQSMGYPEINRAIAEIADQADDVDAVDSTGAELRNKNHWNYAGLKTVGARLVEATRRALAAREEAP
ncbi:MAG: sialate O-acetylesterase [Candidatus Marinimicrobia bacterium]|nr:sialate O-acetylesterase [Candidatus Neomarinimicrobiota bacterium]